MTDRRAQQAAWLRVNMSEAVAPRWAQLRYAMEVMDLMFDGSSQANQSRELMEELIISEGGASNIPPHPADQFAAKCIDIIDYGLVEMTWQGRTKKKHRGCLRFFCGEYAEGDDGKEFPLWVDAWFTLTLNEKGSLRPFLESWRGRPFTADELKQFNLAQLVGADAFIQVVHKPKNGKTYANIASIMRLPRGTEPVQPPADYVRVKDRPKDGESNGSAPSPFDQDDDDLPF